MLAATAEAELKYGEAARDEAPPCFNSVSAVAANIVDTVLRLDFRNLHKFETH